MSRSRKPRPRSSPRRRNRVYDENETVVLSHTTRGDPFFLGVILQSSPRKCGVALAIPRPECRVETRLTEEELDGVQAAAQMSGTTVSSLIRKIVAAYLKAVDLDLVEGAADVCED